MCTQDSDITTLVNMPSMNSRDIIFSLEVGLSRMLSFILSSKFQLHFWGLEVSDVLPL